MHIIRITIVHVVKMIECPATWAIGIIGVSWVVVKSLVPHAKLAWAIPFATRNHPRRMLELVHDYAGGFVDFIPYADDVETKRSDVIVMAPR